MYRGGLWWDTAEAGRGVAGVGGGRRMGGRAIARVHKVGNAVTSASLPPLSLSPLCLIPGHMLTAVRKSRGTKRVEDDFLGVAACSPAHQAIVVTLAPPLPVGSSLVAVILSVGWEQPTSAVYLYLSSWPSQRHPAILPAPSGSRHIRCLGSSARYLAPAERALQSP